MITKQQIKQVLTAYEKLWRERTPAKVPQDVLPNYKVGWTWTLKLLEDITGRPRTFQDRLDLQEPIKRLLRRLRREFPDLPW